MAYYAKGKLYGSYVPLTYYDAEMEREVRHGRQERNGERSRQRDERDRERREGQRESRGTERVERREG